jgi:antitoxin component YwqK of YwqJK toxin-antitoxin module
MIKYIEEYYLEEKLPNYYKNENQKLIKFRGTMVNGKKEGIWIEGYFKNNEYYYNKINYIDNIKQGECIEYYDNGNIKEKCNYKNNKLEGECTEYWENGNIYKEYYYLNNLIEGEYKIYYDNCDIQRKYNYLNGLKNGKYIFYYKKIFLMIVYVVMEMNILKFLII